MLSISSIWIFSCVFLFNVRHYLVSSFSCFCGHKEMDKSIDYTLCFVVAINKIFKTVPKADAKNTHWNSNMNFVIKKKKNCKQFICLLPYYLRWEISFNIINVICILILLCTESKEIFCFLFSAAIECTRALTIHAQFHRTVQSSIKTKIILARSSLRERKTKFIHFRG